MGITSNFTYIWMRFILFNYMTLKKLLLILLTIFSLSITDNVIAQDPRAQQIIDEVNFQRAIRGIPPLKQNKTLDRIAQKKADDMLVNKYFAHKSPKGVSLKHLFERERYNYSAGGENLAKGYTVDEVVKAWMQSQPHKKNIVNKDFTEIGIGITEIHFVQTFGKPY